MFGHSRLLDGSKKLDLDYSFFLSCRDEEYNLSNGDRLGHIGKDRTNIKKTSLGH